MQAPENKWPDTKKAKSLLFVAQAIKQLSNLGTFESFRMMTLDTVSRVREAKSLVSDVEKGLNRKSIEVIAQELCWSLKSDPVVNVKNHDEIAHALKYLENLQISDKTDIARLGSKLDVIERLITLKYKSALENHIIDRLQAENNRADLITSISYYLAYLINHGYSRTFIYDTAD